MVSPVWEYMIVNLYTDSIVDQENAMDAAGEEGWELVSIILVGTLYRAYFKRLV